MAGTAIDGNVLAKELRARSPGAAGAADVGGSVGLATVMVGDDPGALAYERHVRRLAEGLDYHYVNEHLPVDVELADVLATIGKLNADPRVTGILVLRPLPAAPPSRSCTARSIRTRTSKGSTRRTPGCSRWAAPGSSPRRRVVLLPAGLRTCGRSAASPTPSTRGRRSSWWGGRLASASRRSGSVSSATPP